MKLKFLVLRDIGPFRGRHDFDFSQESNNTGYAFFAKNGRGKTSIYNAMKWALFGHVRSKSKVIGNTIIEGANKSIVDEINLENMLMNGDAWKEDTPQEMSVLFVAEGDFGQMQVQRTAHCNSMARKDKDFTISLDVSVDGESFQDGEAEEQIAMIFPSELERFFFIDGEEVETYTTMMKSSTTGIIDDIKSILRLPSLTRGIEDLKSIRRNYDQAIDADAKRQSQASKQADKARTIKGQLMQASKHVSQLEGEVKRLTDRSSNLEKQMAQYEDLQLFAEEKVSTDSKIEVIGDQMKISLNTFIQDFSEAANIILWGKMGSVYDDLVAENDSNQSKQFRLDQLKIEAKKLNETIEAFELVCDKCNQPVVDAKKYLDDRNNELEKKLEQIQEIENSSSADVKELRKKLNALENHFQPTNGSLDRLKRSHQTYVDQQKQYIDLKENQNRLADLVPEDSAGEIKHLATQIAQTSQALMKKESELSNAKFKEEELERSFSNTSPKSSDDGQIDTVFKLRDTIKRFIVGIEDTIKTYSARATKEVETEASKVFLQLSNAQDAFEGIKLDKNFKARMYGSDGRPVIDPSSGMEVIMTLSIIDALRTVSGLNAPVFFDTPARSLDKDHKNGMLNYFWREDRSQFLIFAHSGEFTVEEILENDLALFSRAWELHWPVDLHEECIYCWSKNIEHVSKNENKCNDCGKITDKRKRQTSAKRVEIK